MKSVWCLCVTFSLYLLNVSATRWPDAEVIVMPGQVEQQDDAGFKEASSGTRWAVLVAGSAGYWNYRHQADICHAYQVLRKGGMKDENIIVFMYDDIADHFENPRPGVIINHPDGTDVYNGVPKDYTGTNLTQQNFLAVLLGDRSAVQGGSGKILESGPADHVFIFYSDHGGPGVLGMPNSPNLYAIDWVDTLKSMHSLNRYKEMVIYVEACESGSVFEGLLPDNLNIYVTTASNAYESSWGTYCPGTNPSPPPDYMICIGDLYSVAWMEDSEVNDLNQESLKEQYSTVQMRTSNFNTYESGSHVMQYGKRKIGDESVSLYMGSDPANFNVTHHNFDILLATAASHQLSGVTQRDADLLYFWQKYNNLGENSLDKSSALQKFLDIITWRTQLDKNVELVGKNLVGLNAEVIIKSVHPAGHAVVDDWDCLKQSVIAFEASCGSLGQYGLKHMRVFANICNAGVDASKVKAAAAVVCSSVGGGGGRRMPNPLIPLRT